MFQLIVKEGTVVDGTGRPGRQADIGIEEGRITALGRLNGEPAERTLEAGGLVVSPGWIDIHSHSDFTIMINARAESKIRQGITTEVTGNCGITAAPLPDAHRRELLDFLSVTLGIAGSESLGWEWRTFGDYLDRLRGAPLGINLAPLVGHTTLRIAAMGAANRPATEEELAAMEALLAQSLLEGAFGLSSGLEYPPASYSTPEEMIRLGRVVARHGALYASHVRSEDLALWEAIAEAVEVGERSGCRFEISHLKLGGVRNWGRAPELLGFLDAARERGVDVAWDQYPYVAWGSSLIDYLPHWVAAGGRQELAARLGDHATRQAIRAEIEAAVEAGRHALCSAPWDTVRIALVESEANRHLEGRTIAHLAAEAGRDPLEVVFDLLADERGAVKTLVFCVDEGDIRTILRHPATAVATDGRAVAPYGVLGRGMTHPRYYGAFPRVLAGYVRDERLLSLESAIHKMTLMPARRIGLHDRGRIAPGLVADLTIFDPATIQDRATFERPHEYPAGISYVILGGEVVIERGEHTDQMCGQVLARSKR
ncbi:MAG TPA: D-aminoacylase [Anaerolineae bacterium]|nr:D-aminoacylase [Anaerolineae bacterium]